MINKWKNYKKTIIDDNNLWRLTKVTYTRVYGGCQCYGDCCCREDFVPEDIMLFRVVYKKNSKQTIHSTLDDAYKRIEQIKSFNNEKI